jgi:hypothetical protein
VQEILTGYGPLGIGCIVLAGAVVFLYRDNQKLRDKREEDVKTLLGALAAGTSSSDRIADVIEEFANRLPGWISGRTKVRDRGGPYR